MPKRLRDKVIKRQLGFLAALPFIVLGAAAALYFLSGGWAAVASGIATAFLLFALIEATSRLLLHRAIAEEVQDDVFRQMGLATSIRDAGIDEVRPFVEIDWQAFFREQQGDTFIAGLTLSSWSMDYADVVVQEARGHQVHIMLAHPESRDRRNRDGESFYDVGGHATRTAKHFQELADQAGLGEQFAVSRIRNEFPFSFYVKGGQMWLVLSPLNPDTYRTGRAPAVLCRDNNRDGSLFRWAMDQARALQESGVGDRRERVSHSTSTVRDVTGKDLDDE